MRTALAIIGCVMAAYAFTLGALVVSHMLPSGHSPIMLRLWAIEGGLGSVFFFLWAAIERDFFWRGGARMPTWFGRTWCILLGIAFLSFAVLIVLGKVQ